MKKVSWKQACRWNWHHRPGAKLVWVNGKTGRRSFSTTRITTLLLIIWKYRQAGIPMINPVMTYKGREIEIPAVIEKRGLRMIGKTQEGDGK